MNKALLYDWECRNVHQRTDGDVAFWLALANSVGGPCLELACGTGRVTHPLAVAGIEIVGLDQDPAMLNVARARHDHAHDRWPLLVAADMRRFALARRFGTIIIPYNSLQLLTDDRDVVACLSVAAAHLAGDGLLGLEVTDFQMGAIVSDVPNQLIHTGVFGGDSLRLSGSLHHDFSRRTTHYHRRFDGEAGAMEDDVTIRSLTRGEVGPLLAASGLTPRRWWVNGTMTRVVASRLAA
jgi:SAM-dependent methyltransferase